MIRASLVATALLLAAPAPAQTSSGAWSYHFHMGIGQYMTGEWDSPTGGALNVSCRADGKVAIMAQIKGQAPPAGSVLTLAASSRDGTMESRFLIDATGSAEMAAGAPPFRALWVNLRARDIVTLRYADGRTGVLSLDGAHKLLPVAPCG
ncbi:MAG: hypothetical protein EOP59_02375 [Sphingomonadales bacterium]|nr:MAG: hypothetical protein EOP59_02375 [Sphingomonadales bacterium]